MIYSIITLAVNNDDGSNYYLSIAIA